jgi:O-antigen/teichoic acid export membrane protein
VSSARYIKQLGGETVVYGLAGTINRFVNTLLIPVYTRSFSPSDYGVLGIVLSFVTLLNLLLTGLDNAAGRWFFDSEDVTRRKGVIAIWFWFQVILGSVFALFAVVFAIPLTQLLFGSASSALLIPIAALFALVSIFGKVISNWLRFMRKPWLMLVYSLVSSLSTVGIVVLFVAVWNYGVIGAFVAQVLAGTGVAFATVVILRSWIDPRRNSSAPFREMLAFGLPVLPATLAAWVTSASDRFVMPFFLSTAEIGIYFLAFQVASLMGLVDAAFQLAWGPFAMSLLKNPDAKQVFSRVFSFYAFFGCWLGLALSLLAPVALPIIATPSYTRAASCIPFLVFFFLAIGMTNVAGIGAFVVKDSRPIAINIYIGAGVSTVFLFALMPVIGKEGAAIAKLIGMLSAVAYVYIASQRRFFIPYKLKDMIVSFVFAWLLIGVAQLLPVAGWSALAVRSSLCLLFIPLGFWLGIVRLEHVRQGLTLVSRRLASMTT